MEKIKLIRNAKFWGLRFSDEFMEDYKKIISITNKVLTHLREQLQNGTIVKIDRFCIYLNDGEVYTAAEYNKQFIPHLYDVENKWSLKREILHYCMERYNGYSRRNGDEKIPHIVVKENKSMYIKESRISLDSENKKLIVPTLYRTHEIPFSYSLKDEYINGKFGGNFVIDQNVFVAAVEFENQVLYNPEHTMSFDINKTTEDWLVFNGGGRIPHPEKALKLIENIREINKLLKVDKNKKVSERMYKSKQRSKIRYKWIDMHRELKNEIAKVAAFICNAAIKNKSLLCIDSVKTGQSNGTFGQDHLIPMLRTMCENRGIPFYIVPCKNTSRRCSVCGYIDKENRISTNEFCCQDCGYQCDAQLNGADNIAFSGNKLFEAGVPYGDWSRNKIETLIEKFCNQQS